MAGLRSYSPPQVDRIERIWGLSNILLSQKQPFCRPFADLSRAFARSIFLSCATNLIQIPFTCPVFDRMLNAWKFC